MKDNIQSDPFRPEKGQPSRGNSVHLLKDAREIGWEGNDSIQDGGCYLRVTKGWN